MRYLNYPEPEATNTPYEPLPTANNPVIRGSLLNILRAIVTYVKPLQDFFYANAGFSVLHAIDKLEDVEPRFDPTVIPLGDQSPDSTNGVYDLGNLLSSYTNPSNYFPTPTSATEQSGHYYTVLDFHNAYRTGRTTPAEVIEFLLPLIRKDIEPRSEHAVAFLETDVDRVVADAEASTRRYKEKKELGVLDGVPFSVKDEVDLKGYRTRYGTAVEFTQKTDKKEKKEVTRTSWCVEKWQEAGAVLIGKTSMHELGSDTTNNNPVHGTPLNPYNRNYYTGGSSGGSGYAIGAGLVPVALGADGGGSIRIPSSYCGIFGLKPSHGRISASPTKSRCATTGVVGPMAANMVDLEVAYRVMATPLKQEQGYFPAPAKPIAIAPTEAAPTRPAKRLGIYKPWFDRADPPVRHACEAAIAYLVQHHNYTTVPVSIPLLPQGQLAHGTTILSEMVASTPAHVMPYLSAPTQVLLMIGSRSPARDFLAAQRLRAVQMRRLAYLFREKKEDDGGDDGDGKGELIIVSPTTPTAGSRIVGGASDLRCGVSDANAGLKSMEFTYLANFTGAPALSVPVGYVDCEGGGGGGDGDGGRIPVGLMGMSEWGGEEELIRWGYDVEKYLHGGLEGGRVRPKSWVDVLTSDVGDDENKESMESKD